MSERKRDGMIAHLRRCIAQIGIPLADLTAALAEGRRRQKSVRDRNVLGETWSGKGDMPQWLNQSESADYKGYSIWGRATRQVHGYAASGTITRNNKLVETSGALGSFESEDEAELVGLNWCRAWVDNHC